LHNLFFDDSLLPRFTGQIDAAAASLHKFVSVLGEKRVKPPKSLNIIKNYCSVLKKIAFFLKKICTVKK